MKHNYLTTILSAVFLVAMFSVKAQNYSVTSIPFQEYTATAAVDGTSDDMYSSVLSLPFDFDFYGNSHNALVVGTNGVITFDSTLAGGFCPWSFTQPVPDPTFSVKNSLLGCFHDMDNSDAEGTITYAVAGAAPYRKFVVMFDNNSQFSCMAAAKSSFQMVLYETLNIMDVQIIDKQLCPQWNDGNAVVGVISSDGTMGIAAPGRNTGAWTAYHEGWRFARPLNPGTYNYTICASGSVGTFLLSVPQNDLLPSNPSGVTFYTNQADAASQTNPISGTFYVSDFPGTIYANVLGAITTINLNGIDCNNDFDGDSVATTDEDLNADGNLGNDDTDADGIPDFADNDDDGDLILTSVEYVFGDRSTAAAALLDTDSDGIPNYLDSDDDGDGVLTMNEDYNGNHDPLDDDTNADGTPDYLDNAVTLGTATAAMADHAVKIYPNPATDVLNIDNRSGKAITAVTLYTINGVVLREAPATGTLTTLNVADLQTGIYFLKVQMGSDTRNYKFIRK